MNMRFLKLGLIHGVILFALLMPLYATFAAGDCSGGGTICNPLNGNDNLVDFFNTIIDKIIIPVGAVLAFLALLYAGFLFVTAGGDETKISTAKQNVLYVVIGAAIILGAKIIAVGIKNTLDAVSG